MIKNFKELRERVKSSRPLVVSVQQQLIRNCFWR